MCVGCPETVILSPVASVLHCPDYIASRGKEHLNPQITISSEFKLQFCHLRSFLMTNVEILWLILLSFLQFAVQSNKNIKYETINFVGSLYTWCIEI